MLATLTSLLQSWLRIRRMLAFAAVLAALGLAVALGVWLRGPALAQQFGQLQLDVPDAARRLYSSLGESSWGRWILSNAPDDGQWSGWLSYAASGIRGAVSLLRLRLPACCWWSWRACTLLQSRSSTLRGMQRIAPSSIWPRVEACLGGAVRTLRFWLLSRLISMTAVGLMVTAGLALLGIPLAGTLGIITALLTFIPNIGPIVSALPAALLAFAISPAKGFLTIGVFCLAHFIEGNFVTPLQIGRS